MLICSRFFVHERGRGLSYYLFGQQLGSIIGLITGGSMADTIGWRWSQYIVAIIEGVVFVLMLFTFEETLFPRFLFSGRSAGAEGAVKIVESPSAGTQPHDMPDVKGGLEDDKVPMPTESDPCEADPEVGEVLVSDFPKRSWAQKLRLWTLYPQDRTSYWTYFFRPFFLFSFPNVVIAGFIFAFSCTAGIVTFNTISEILTSPPYNFSTTATGLVFLAALVGNIIGWAAGVLGDFIVLRLARRNGGVKEPEMRLWTLWICAVYAATGYFLYGWGAEKGHNWFSIAFAIGCVIAHQVSACSVATAYAMECFPGVRF
jgi:MFS family permease